MGTKCPKCDTDNPSNSKYCKESFYEKKNYHHFFCMSYLSCSPYAPAYQASSGAFEQDRTA